MTINVERINPPTLHSTPGYHHVTVVPRATTAYIAGQMPLDQSGELVGDGDLQAQVDQVVINSIAALTALGAHPEAVVRAVIYVASNDSETLVRTARMLSRSALEPAFTGSASLLGVAALAVPGQLLELELTAVLPDAGAQVS